MVVRGWEGGGALVRLGLASRLRWPLGDGGGGGWCWHGGAAPFGAYTYDTYPPYLYQGLIQAVSTVSGPRYCIWTQIQ